MLHYSRLTFEVLFTSSLHLSIVVKGPVMSVNVMAAKQYKYFLLQVLKKETATMIIAQGVGAASMAEHHNVLCIDCSLQLTAAQVLGHKPNS